MCVVSRFGLQVEQARFENGQGELKFAGYPPAGPFTRPGRQYTNLSFASQDARPEELPIRNVTPVDCHRLSHRPRRFPNFCDPRKQNFAFAPRTTPCELLESLRL